MLFFGTCQAGFDTILANKGNGVEWLRSEMGRKGEDIHIFGRITAVADVFDALSAERVYKEAWPLEKIENLFREERGRHFDPDVVDAFFTQLPKLLEIRKRLTDEE
jgi:response regulator RpfG family c-di-GMP phosphodiesterase